MEKPLEQLPQNAPMPLAEAERLAIKRTQQVVLITSISLVVVLGLIFYIVYKRSKK